MNTGHLNGQGLAELRGYNFQNLSSAPTTNLYKGRFYFNTTDNTLYVYTGTQWLDALAQGTTYTEGPGIDITSNTISVDIATGANAGNVTLTADSNGLAASAPSASTSTAGLIEIATDTEASTGTDTSRAVNPKQLATKVDKPATAPTAGNYTKVTINSDGLVTSGGLLQASDIPDITLSKITDVTATTSEINILDGVTVTTSDINSIPDKIELTDLSIDSGSSNYLTYDNTTGEIGANVDTTVTSSSTNLVTSGAVSSAIASAITGGMVYKGVWTATGQTDYSSITLPVKAGYMYLVSGSATIGGIEWNTDDYLVINADVAVGGTITDVKKIDNTEGSDIVRLNASQTLTNKIIDADDNTISDLTTSNFKSGTVVTTITSASTDATLPTALAVYNIVTSAIGALSYSAQNPSLTASGGVCTWPVTHNLNNSNVDVAVYEVSSGERVMYDYAITSANVVTVKILSASNISADAYKVVVQG